MLVERKMLNLNRLDGPPIGEGRQLVRCWTTRRSSRIGTAAQLEPPLLPVGSPDAMLERVGRVSTIERQG